MTLKERAEKAVMLKNSGMCNCAQAVSIALADETGLSEQQLMQLSAGFCAGMGNLQATCGAVIGAGMAAGMKSKGQGTLRLTKAIQEEFVKRCGALKCGDLKAMTDGKPLCPCEVCVENAVLIYGEVMGL